MEEISIRQYAKRKGVSDTTIHKLRKSGALPSDCFGVNRANGRPTVIVPIADKAWAAHYGETKKAEPVKAKDTKVSKQYPAAKATKPKATKHKVVVIDDELEDAAEALEDALTVKATDNKVDIEKRKLIADLEVKKLNLGKLRGQLVEREAVYKALFEFAQELRNHILAVPDRIVDSVRASEDRHEGHKIIYDELYSVLERLSRADNVIK